MYEYYHCDFEVRILRKWNVLQYFNFFFLSSVEGLHAIVVSDRDGVPVIKGKTEYLCANVMFAFE